MTPSQRAKELGCNSLAQVSRAVEQSEQTLINWYKSRPNVFDACCMYATKDGEKGERKDMQTV